MMFCPLHKDGQVAAAAEPTTLLLACRRYKRKPAECGIDLWANA